MSTTKIIRSTASLSWIDPKIGLPEEDLGNPGPSLKRQDIFDKMKYRFSNFLEGCITLNAVGRIIGARVTEASGMYRTLSYMDLPSFAYGFFPIVARSGDKATFTQLVGCRTHSPEILGGRVGAVVGKLVSLGFVPVSPLVIPAGVILGKKSGSSVAKKSLSLPPIYSELELTIYASGRSESKLLRHSVFPSLSFYLQRPVFSLGRLLNPWAVANPGPRWVPDVNVSIMSDDYDQQDPAYDGDAARYAAWKKNGWGTIAQSTGSGPVDGNPWDINQPDDDQR